MLILTRRVGESIVVGDDIVLTVFEVRGDAVRVGIEAPRSVQVHRQEVYEELKRVNQQAMSPSDDAVDALRGALGASADRSREAPAPAPAPAAPPATPGAAARQPVQRHAAQPAQQSSAQPGTGRGASSARAGQNPPMPAKAPRPPAKPRSPSPGRQPTDPRTPPPGA